jgi:hypothetical protein
VKVFGEETVNVLARAGDRGKILELGQMICHEIEDLVREIKKLHVENG